jgi:hypothetical protein
MAYAFRKDSENSQAMCIEERRCKADIQFTCRTGRRSIHNMEEKEMRFQTRVQRAAGLMGITVLAFATPYLKGDALTQVTVDTSGYANQNAVLAFDFVGGGPNTVTISNFMTDGIVVTESITGGVTGILPGDFTLDDTTQFFNELTAGTALGQKLVFDFQTTNLAPTGSFPDEFTLFILDPATQMSIIPSSDPTGAESLLAIDLTGGSAPQASIYSPLVTLGAPTVATVAAPEPSSALLLTGSLLVLVGMRSGRARVRHFLRGLRGVTCLAAVWMVFVGAAHAQGIVTGVAQDPNFTVSFSGLRLDRISNTMVSTATVRNTSSSTIQGPFYLGITSITEPSVTLANGGGNLPDGNPFVAIPSISSLLPGQPATVTLSFHVTANAPFGIQAKIYDAVSAPPVATLTCPTDIVDFGIMPLTASYTPPTDSLGRMASCSPPALSKLYNPSTTINCLSSGGPSLPAACSFHYNLGTIAGTGPITIVGPPPPPPGPQPADLALVPCAGIAPLLAPWMPPPPPIDYLNYCGFPVLGTVGEANFTVVNYGPATAYNFSISLLLPPGVATAAWRFSRDGTCGPVTPVSVNLDILGVLFPSVGHSVTCTFAQLNPWETMDATLGIDLVSGGTYTSVPDLEVHVSVDPASNFDPNSTNNAIQATVNPGFQSITVPQTLVPKSGCDYSSSPGFAILLNTCGVPTVVTEALVGTFLGAATLIAGAGGVAVEVVPGAIYLTVLRSGQVAASVLLIR